MDTTDSAITFDAEGMCDHCLTFFDKISPNWNAGDTSLDKLHILAHKIKQDGAGKEFDCIVGMSGGIDSSYLVHFITTELKLRPLVFHVDAGWNSQIAVNNIERIIDKLDVDLFTHVIDWEEMADLQLAFFKSGVSHIDTPQDHAFFATMYKFASKYNVKHILTGANYSTESIRNPAEWMYHQSDLIQIRDIHKKFGAVPLRTFPLVSILWYKIWLPYFRGIKVHHPLNFIDYNKQDAMNVLQRTYDWQPYPQKHFESRFTRFYESYWLPMRFGYDVRKVQYSSLILSNQMTRKEALEKLSKPTYDEETVGQDIEYICNKLNISRTDFDTFFGLPKKSYKDYRNLSAVYLLGSALFRAFGLQRGGKR